jgi:hypothetical protein
MLSSLKRLFGKKEPEEHLVPVFIPPLANMLWHQEKSKGSPLVEAEVIAIRDRSVAMMMRSSRAQKMEEARGYRDIRPESCWLEWREMRRALRDEPKA